MFLRSHSRLHVSDKVWVGDGGARLFPIPAANVQYACNNRNFANRRETGLCPLLSRQPKPQSHTKRNKRKWGMGGVHKLREDVLVRKKKERSEDKQTVMKQRERKKV